MCIADEFLIHLAGTWYPDSGQMCVICGLELDVGVEVEALENAWDAVDTVVNGWRQGASVLEGAEEWIDVTDVQELETTHPQARQCTLADSVPSWD